MADTIHQPASGRPNVSPTRPRPFYRSRLLLQLLTVVAVAITFCMSISIFFKVETITVSGAELYSAWSVAEASGIQEGDNLLFFGRSSAAGRIKLALPFVKNARITIQLPGTVHIYVEEAHVVYSIKDQNGVWWLMTADGKLVQQISGAEAAEHTVVEGILLANPEVSGQAIAWESDGEGQTAILNSDRLRAALVIMQQLERNEILGQVATIDVSELLQLKLQYGDRYTILLGDGNDMHEKIPIMKSAIAQMGAFQTGTLRIEKTDGAWKVVHTAQ